jgi:RNA polymerase sigma-70 factor, ECF subfamily
VSASLEELERLYRARFGEFLRVATALTGNVDSGREAVHDGFVGAVRSRGQFRRFGSLEGWVWKAVVNSALSGKRRERTRRESRLDDDAQEPRGTSRTPEVLTDIRSAVSELPERQRLVLFLRYYADLDYEAIAEAIGVSRGTVGATLHAAHKVLRERLKEVPVR